MAELQLLTCTSGRFPRVFRVHGTIRIVLLRRFRDVSVTAGSQTSTQGIQRFVDTYHLDALCRKQTYGGLVNGDGGRGLESI